LGRPVVERLTKGGHTVRILTRSAEKALGKRLYTYGPEAITLSDAMERFAAACQPSARVFHLKLWQARLVA
jgi:nucleoside-diphosphate-sugar epimerase